MTKEAQRLVEDNHTLICMMWLRLDCAKQQIIITPINISFLHMRIDVCITKCGKIIGDIRT